MQRDFNTRQPDETESIGDVLASIRRLIAQDQAERPAAGHGEMQPPFSRPSPLRGLTAPPLVLAQRDQIAGDDPTPAGMDLPDATFSAEDEAEFAEAEAALARMIAPARSLAPESPLPEAEPNAGAEITHLPVLNLFAGTDSEQPALRDLIREILQQELAGEMGLRVSRQLHQLVRQEVETVIRDICAEP